jgi:membrane protein required for colicin V production
MNFTWFDILLTVILLWSALSGLRAGFARVVIGLIATVIGFLAGFWCYRLLAAKLAPWIDTPMLANILGFLIIFVGALILGSLAATLLSRMFRWIGLSWFNHVLGGVAGFLRGALVIAAMLDMFVAFAPSPTPAFLENSRVLPYACEVSAWLADLAPRELKDAFREQMQNLKQFWSTPADRRGRLA